MYLEDNVESVVGNCTHWTSKKRDIFKIWQLGKRINVGKILDFVIVQNKLLKKKDKNPKSFQSLQNSRRLIL